jgi:hypothetical protein
VHSPLLAHGLQIPVATVHTGVSPPHCASAVQLSVHAPESWQKGVLPPQLLLSTQGSQRPVVVLQMGSVPEQSSLASHPGTQRPTPVSQSGVGWAH